MHAVDVESLSVDRRTKTIQNFLDGPKQRFSELFLALLLPVNLDYRIHSPNLNSISLVNHKIRRIFVRPLDIRMAL